MADGEGAAGLAEKLAGLSADGGEEPQLSKNAKKREEKRKKQEEERRLKEEEKKNKAAAAAASGKPQKASAADDEDMDPTQYYENRLKTLDSLKAMGAKPYPHKFPVNISVPGYIEKYKSLSEGEKLLDVTECLAGRIMNKRTSSSKLFFYDLFGDGVKVQVMADARRVLYGLLRLVDSCRTPAHLPSLCAAHARLLLLQHHLPSHPSTAVACVKLIQAYAACSALPVARAVLMSSPNRTTIFFNVLLRALTAASLHRDVLILFASMRPQGPSCFPDHYTYPLALKSCAASSGLILGVQIHSAVARLGLDANLFVAHSAITMYARCGRPGDAYQMFDEMRHRDVVSWNALISGFAHAGLFGRAVGVFRDLVGLKCPRPDAGTMASILPALGNAKAEDITFVRAVFDEMQFRGLTSWNAMLSIYAINGLHVKAVELFTRMEKDGVEPDAVTLATILPSCGEVSAFSLGKRIHEIIKRKRMCPNMLLENALMDMYAKCGCLKDARDVFDSMSARDVVSWTSIISAYGVHGHGTEAIDLFENMRGQGLEPDSIAFVAVLAACSHAGFLDVGKHYFDCMTSRYQLTPKTEHYTCMVDLLGRAGCISEAYNFIMTMPIEPNERVWGALLGACRIHSNMDIGLLAADSLFSLVPDQTGYYVLLSNIYARAGRWADVTSVRSVMASRGIKKLPGCSNVEIGDQVHTFHVGDRSHPQSEIIYDKLDELLGRIRGMGYNPEVEATLHDVEEEDKEGHLSVHSEKLAIAFVLINSSPGTPIRITMNLRTCGDCHHAAKLISTITNREIILKDINRFHHIVQGVCSCGDYW